MHTAVIFHDEKASFKKDQVREMELALWLRALIARAQDLGLAASTYLLAQKHLLSPVPKYLMPPSGLRQQT